MGTLLHPGNVALSCNIDGNRHAVLNVSGHWYNRSTAQSCCETSLPTNK